MPTKELFPLRSGLSHLGRFADKEGELLQLAQRDPKTAGLELYQQGRYEEAEAVLRWAAENDAESYELQFALGRSLFEISRWGESEPYFARAVELQPYSLAARYHYAEALLKSGRYTEAESQLQRIVNRQTAWKKLRSKFAAVVGVFRDTRKDSILPPPVNPPGNDVNAKLEFARARKEMIQNARKRILSRDKLNPSWRRAERGRKLTVRNTPIIAPETKIFTMGSCFALEIRHELTRQGFNVFPKYFDIQFDTRSQILDSLPERDNINHYDTFTIRQEIEIAFGGQNYGAEDFWEIKDRAINRVMHRRAVYQDPYRKSIFASDPDGIVDASRKIGETIKDGLISADVYIFTLGLIETWVNPTNGLHVCCFPGVGGGGGDEGQSVLHVSTFQENYENMKRVCDLIFAKFPGKKIILTVSPVALERTFRDVDIVVANTESKSLLRAVAGQLCREFPSVYYLPSYEMFLYHDLFHDNGRHATRNGVEVVFELFAKSFMAPGEKTGAGV